MERPDHWLEEKIYFNAKMDRALKITIPFVLAGLYAVFLFLVLTWDDMLKLLTFMTAYLIPPAGKESVIPLGIAAGLPWWLVATSMAFMDFDAGLFMAWNFDIALKVPLLGKWIEKFMKGGRRFFEQRPYIEKLSFVGIMLFVMFPLQGSGGIGGSIVGRMLGMTKQKVLAAITLGAFIGTFAIALGASYVKVMFQQDFIKGLSAAAVFIFILALVYIYHWNKKRQAKKNGKKDEE